MHIQTLAEQQNESKPDATQLIDVAQSLETEPYLNQWVAVAFHSSISFQPVATCPLKLKTDWAPVLPSLSRKAGGLRHHATTNSCTVSSLDRTCQQPTVPAINPKRWQTLHVCKQYTSHRQRSHASNMQIPVAKVHLVL